MSALRIALVACANGLGHIRRMLSLSLALRDAGASPTLIAPKSAVQRLSEIYEVPLPNIINHEITIRNAPWLKSDANCWTDDFPCLDSFDEVVSDNLIEILALRPRAWLSGTFFWHMALRQFPQHRALRAEELLALYRPRMIASKLFAAPYLAQKTELHKIGLYALGNIIRINGRRDILISCGKGGGARAVTQRTLKKIASGLQPGTSTLWVEPDLHRDEMPGWIRRASFKTTMYHRLAVAVIRPGVGTVTDCLAAGAKLFMFYESDDSEMQHNAEQITINQLGNAFPSPEDAWFAALDYLSALQKKNLPPIIESTLDFNGATQATSLLLADQSRDCILNK